MSCKLPILDDNERSPHWAKHQRQDVTLPPPANQASTASQSGKTASSKTLLSEVTLKELSSKEKQKQSGSLGWMWLVLIAVIAVSLMLAWMIGSGKMPDSLVSARSVLCPLCISYVIV